MLSLLHLKRISSKVYLGFAIPATTILGIGIFSLYSFAQIDGKIGTIYDNRVIPLEQLKSISDNYGIHVIDATNKANNGLVSPREGLRQVNLASEQIEQKWNEYLSTELTPEESKLVEETKELFIPANQQIEQLKMALEKGDRQALSKLDGALYTTIDPLTNKLQELIDLQLRVAQQERQASAILYQQTRTVFLFLLGFSLLLASPLGYFISRVITRTLKETIDQVAKASQEIAIATEQHEQVASQQAAAVHQTTATMHELGTSAQHSAEQAQSAAIGAEQVSELTVSGIQTVNTTLQAMADLKTKVEGISEQTLNLSRQTNEIATISSLVADLANQTNMLALNAAVEAVRAGNQGKGFAIVAEEIRKLADQSKLAAEKINTLVANVQSAINSTILATEVGTKTVKHGTETAEKTAESFSHVSDAIQTVATSSQQISLNVKQQAIAIQQIIDTMGALNDSALQTASGIQQTRVGTQQLKQVTEQLQETI